MLGLDDYGNPDPGASPVETTPGGPGYADRWFDVRNRTFSGSANAS